MKRIVLLPTPIRKLTTVLRENFRNTPVLHSVETGLHIIKVVTGSRYFCTYYKHSKISRICCVLLCNVNDQTAILGTVPQFACRVGKLRVSSA
jgi:hypothetical protein